MITIAISIITLIFVSILIVLMVTNMLTPDSNLIWCVLSYVAILLFIIMMMVILNDLSYKKGQIDALSGKAKYELKTQSDSTRVWVKKGE